MDDKDRTQKALELYQFLDDYANIGHIKFDTKYPEYCEWKNAHRQAHIIDYIYLKYIN